MSTEKITINAELRTECSKGSTRRSRNAGVVPGIIYGKNKATAISILARDLPKMHTRTQTVSVVVGAETKSCIMREVQTHPVTDQVLHLDFQEVSPDEVVRVRVPLEFVGLTREQEKEGFLKPLVRSLEVKGMYKNIPETIKVEVGTLKAEETALMKSLTLPAGVRTKAAPSVALATLIRK